MNTAFIFPGQGSQAIAMAKDLYDSFSLAREIFGEIDEALKQNLSKIIFEGPIDELTRTENTQPALMAASMAFLAVMKEQSGRNIEQLCNMVAGHSVGEYSALCAAGSLSIKDAAKILRIRGNAMQNACPKGEGAMAACLGLTIEKIEEIVLDANNHGICDVANDNTAAQVVISGENKAVEYASSKVTEAGGRAIKLNVSGPFHSRLMKDAEEIMGQSLSELGFAAPTVPVILNVTANSSKNIEEIKVSLVKQISGRVRWRETISYFADNNIDTIVEIGSGKVLTGMLRKLDHGFTLKNVGNIIELEEFLKH
jgi:[acyl-carrier-protein] S-malonyltransferase